jgi:hypothetical protein
MTPERLQYIRGEAQRGRTSWAKSTIPELLGFIDELQVEVGARPRPMCAEIVDDRPCGRLAMRFHAESKVPFCEEHGGQNPRYSKP